MTDDPKRKLTPQEQIDHLKAKGVQFNIMTEPDALAYLAANSNYFKLAAYRKNYQKHPGGINEGKYVHLEFAYLVDLASIDRALRYTLVQLAMDIEHHVRLEILHLVDESDDDGYDVVEDFIASLDNAQAKQFKNEINRNRNSIYSGGLVKKYKDNLPIWVLVELISFGNLIRLYKFCGERYHIRESKYIFYELLHSKEVRNASAHNICILNDLKEDSSVHRIQNKNVINSLSEIPDLSKNFRHARMRNARVNELVTLLHLHKMMVKSTNMNQRASRQLKALVNRFYQHEEYYMDNTQIINTFKFLKIVIDNWFKTI
ncbi:MAG: Abi family protein [Peptococcaceae bacterium]|nr:Abi family protein [Peptococcaceae bacterium]